METHMSERSVREDKIRVQVPHCTCGALALKE